MKTKLISIFLAICMVLTLCPVSGYAASVEVSQGTALSGTEPSAQGAAEAASVESTAGNTDENASESTAESTTESSEEALADGAVPDEAVSAVQAQIDALPTAEELSAMDEEAFNAAGEQIHTAHDAYTALTEAQQAEITGAECFDTLFAVLNQGVSGRLFAVLTQAAVTPAQPSGSGTAADPYQIGTEAQLWWFAGVVNGTLTDGTAQNTAACARLTADITMSADTDWIPIAPGNDITAGSVSYTGTFDGNYHSITGLSAQVVVSGDKYPDADYGMFGYVGASGAIKNLMLSANSVHGYNDVGVLCGSNYGTIENCVVSISGTAGSTGVGSDVGGVCGNSYGTVKNCIFTGSSYGISGGFYGGTVENCYYLGTSETDSRDGTTFKTAAQFASGEVAYLLNGSTSTGTLVWYQTIGTDSYPSFSGGTVYCGYYAYDSNGFRTLGYSNGNTEVGEYEAVTKDSNGVYQIANAGQLYSFAEIVNSGANSAVEINAVLTADIDINPSYTFAADGTYSGGTSPRAWTPIGNASYNNTGTFDGQNHTVSGVYINGSNNYVGLFGSYDGTIQNIKLTNSYISGAQYVGGICGKIVNNLADNVLSNCSNAATVKGSGYYVGGIAGYSSVDISSCSNTGTVTGSSDDVGGVCGKTDKQDTINSYNTGAVNGANTVGGICGLNGGTISNSYDTGAVNGITKVGGVCGLNCGTLSDSYNTGAVSGTGNYVGGVCGYNCSTLSSSYNTGTVTGTGNYVGGVCGYNAPGSSTNATITNCYNTGTVTGTSSYVGGVCGFCGFITTSNSTISSITNCYNTGTVTGTGYYVGGVCGYIGGTISGSYYLSGCATDGNNVTQNGVGGNIEGSSTADAAGSAASKTAAQFASGEVCWLLNGSASTGVWKQNIDNGVTPYDASPNFTSAAVYYVNYAGSYDENGFGSPASYSNTASTNSIYQPATLNDNGTTDDATDDYYEIANAGQLYWFAEKVNQTDGSGRGLHGKLTADITVNTGDVSGCGGTKAGGWRDWTPINSYSGIFDGCGKTISGLYLSSDIHIDVALFGYYLFGTVKNLTLTNSYFSGDGYSTGGICGINNGTVQNCVNEATVCGTGFNTGGICGKNEGGTISGCTNRGSVTSPDMYVGGICGCNTVNGTDSVGTVENCTNSGTVTGLAGVGGICGSSEGGGGNITNCYNTAAVTGTGTDGNVGGICGSLESGALSDCGNTGAVSGTRYIGGIAGLNDVTISSAYNTGAVSGTYYIGGIAGRKNGSDGTVTNAYYLEGCAKDGDGTVQYGIGNATQGSTTADVAGSATAKTAAQFASGEVCWLLNGSASTGVWKQNIDNGVTPYDASPNFTGAAVYYGYMTYDTNGFGSTMGYSNTALEMSEYQPAALNNNGTADDATDDYYEIANAGQLCWFAAKVNAGDTAISGKLKADIDLTGVTWSGIGNASNTFSGTFDGGGFAISNMNSAKTNQSPGLIYALGANGVVKKLTMKSAYAFDQNGSNKGIVVGANSGSIEAVFVTDSQITMGNYDGMGGIAGKNTGTISNCAVVNVTFTRCWGAIGSNKVSGAITETNDGTVSNCYSYGITFTGGTDANAGALVATGTAPVNSYYLSADIGTDNKVAAGAGGTAKTAAQFASGEVCWLLNGSASTGVWKQNIDNGVTPYDASPNFTGAAVYYGYMTYDTNGFCSTMSYSNTASTNSIYQPATLNNNGTTDDATDDYYEIANAGQLYWFAEKVNQTDGSGRGLNGKLTADITVNTGDVSGCGGTKAGGWRDWTPINPYSGIFDGCGKTISGLYLSSNIYIDVALFGYYMFGTVKNLTLTNSYFSGGEDTGGICGINNGTVQNCVNEATVCGTGYNTGGICGKNEGGTISGCTNRGSVTSLDPHVGGICGDNTVNDADSGGTVENCTNSGTVTGSYAVGGICGSSDSGSNITNCYNTGDVVGTGEAGNVGGICGLVNGALSNCGNTGAVSGTIQVGGIAGINFSTISSAYNTGAVTGSSNQVGGIAGKNGSDGTVTSAYNTGTVSGSSNQVGGIAGYNIGTVTNAYYLADCAKDGDGTAQNGIGNATLGSSTADVAGSTTAKTAAQFASGEVCWLLNGSASTGVWKQNIDNGVTPYDASPNFTGAAVYFVESQSKYTNSEVVSVDITWGAMDFTYSDGTWNAATHQYDGAGWTAAEGGNAVTVKNSGAVNVSATLSYTPTAAYTAITGSFDSDVTAAIAINEEKKWLLSLSGKPAEAMSNIKLGTVTVTIGGE